MMQTFIFVHDQEIVLDFIDAKKFQYLDGLTFVFVGNNPIDKIESIPNVIICRDLKYNLEDYPKLTSFTGWYALWKNNLVTSDKINLFEYDINVPDNLKNIIDDKLNNGCNILGYIPLGVNDFNYIQHSRWIEKISSSLEKVYKINLKNFIKSVGAFTTVSVTSNHSMTKKTFEEYMSWIEPMIDEVKTSDYSGHEVERSISLFYLINNLDYCISENTIHHYQFDSHRTQSISPEKFVKNYKKLLQ